jgi:hypothetical protein
MTERMNFKLPDFDKGPCPAWEACLTPETCLEPVRCLIDRAAAHLGEPRQLIVDTQTYCFWAAHG